MKLISFRPKIIFIATLSIIIVNLLFAQPTNIKFDQIGLEQGLSQSTVYAITQDAQGFMWFATQEMLSHNDGNSASVFKLNPSDFLSI